MLWWAMDDERQRWLSALDDLASWHTDRDRRAAERALGFLEKELRRRIPRRVRGRWPPEEIEEALQGVLMRFLQREIPENGRQNPAAYVTKIFRNWCLDIERGRTRRATEPLTDAHAAQAATPAVGAAGLELSRLAAALADMPVEDRVVLKLAAAPATLTWGELTWLGSRTGESAEAVRDAVFACREVYDLTLIFDPGPPPENTKERRKRMERFRKRRERARSKLRDALDGDL